MDEIRVLSDSPDESYNRLSKAICTFVGAFAVAFVAAVLIINCLFRRLRRCVDESRRPAASPPGQRCRSHEVEIPAHIYGGGQPSESPGATTSDECTICLGEFEKGEWVSVLPQCKHEFHRDCIEQWVPVKSVNCPICRVPAVGGTARAASTDCGSDGFTIHGYLHQ